MPIMIRPSGKAKRIAYAILGKPENMEKRTSKEKAVDKRLTFEETTRVR